MLTPQERGHRHRRIPGLERVGDDGQGDGNRFRSVTPRTVTTQMIFSAACALTMLAFLAAAARLATTANTARVDSRCVLY